MSKTPIFYPLGQLSYWLLQSCDFHGGAAFFLGYYYSRRSHCFPRSNGMIDLRLDLKNGVIWRVGVNAFWMTHFKGPPKKSG